MPRVVPIGIHRDGRQIVIGTPANASRLKALRMDPNIALTIDTADFPYNVLHVPDDGGVAERMS